MENKTNKLEILVIEDQQQNIAIARSAFEGKSEMQFHYSSNYEDSLKVINERKIDGIITDLFFPASTISAKKVYEDLENQLEMRKTYRVEAFNELEEEPSGLLIAEKAINLDIPLIILSQGDRHVGGLGAVRYFFEELKRRLQLMVSPVFGDSGEEKEIYKDIISKNALLGHLVKHHLDIKDLFLNRNGVDKNSYGTWNNALEYIQEMKGGK